MLETKLTQLKGYRLNTWHIGPIWHCCLNNSFRCLNNNNTSDTYFYNTQTRFTKLKIEQKNLNTTTRRAHSLSKKNP